MGVPAFPAVPLLFIHFFVFYSAELIPKRALTFQMNSPPILNKQVFSTFPDQVRKCQSLDIKACVG